MLLSPEWKERFRIKLKALNALRPLPSSSVTKLREKFEIEMTYNSNAIEGNSLTLKETFLVIHEGMTIKGKPFKDHLEATNHKEALDYLYALIEHDKNQTISEHLLKNLHHLVTQQIEKEWAGRYRNAGVIITGTRHRPSDALAIPSLMRDLMLWAGEEESKLHPVEFSAMLHHKLVHIHPFFDGNGRTARLVMNLTLLKRGYPLAIILKNDRKKYYQVLQQADEGIFEPLVQFIAQTVDRSLSIYLDVLSPSRKEKPKYASLQEISNKSRYSAKYLNLLAARGKLQAHKDGRNWVTTKEALLEYEKNRKRKRG